MSEEKAEDTVEVPRSQLQQWLEEIRELRRSASKRTPESAPRDS